MDRPHLFDDLDKIFQTFPIAVLLGPRQCGKTTLARQFAQRTKTITPVTASVAWNANTTEVSHFDLEDPQDVAALESASLTLRSLRGLVVLDEIQRRPELFPVLRVLVDRPDNATRFLILGSASRDLIRQSSETLAGRMGVLEMGPFGLDEIQQDAARKTQATALGEADQTTPRLPRDLLQRHWLRGGFPRAYLAHTLEASRLWRREYVASFLERDLPALGINIAPASLRRFWMMLAHYHGQVLNYSELGRSFGASDVTVRRYLEVLAATFMVRLLPPWYENIGKRQVKAPKLYLRDSGLFHTLMGIGDHQALTRHPKLGASWEGYALEQILRRTQAMPGEIYFWATHGGGEVDLLLVTDAGREGFEIKYTDQPRTTRGMHTALQTLGLERLTIIYPGERSFDLDDKISAVSLAQWIAS